MQEDKENLNRTSWDTIFESELWCTDLEPRKFVTDNIEGLAQSAAILDLGCGCGRHTIYLAANGYDAYGIDNSAVALDRTRERLDSFGLSATLEHCDMWNIPFDNDTFSAVLSINVLNHAMPSNIRSTVSVVSDKLSDDGIFLVTLLTDNDYRKCGQQVDANTFICDRGPESGVLHTFFSKDGADELFKDEFKIESMEITSIEEKIDGSDMALREFFCIKAKKR